MSNKTYTGSATATSTWKVTYDGTKNVMSQSPTTGKATVTFNTSDLKGKKFVSAELKWSMGSSAAGTVTFAGSNRSPGSKGVNVTLGRSVEYTLTFKATGNTASVGTFSATGTVYASLVVKYTSSSSSTGTTVVSQTGTFDTPTTGDVALGSDVCIIIDQEIGKQYVFDGTAKVNHSLTLKIDEEVSSKDKAKYINNAKNEPNKVVLDVAISDVHTRTSDLTVKNAVRSVSAFEVMNELKTSRRLVQLITPLFTYNRMLLSGISVSQEADIQFGWVGQLTFQEAYRPKQEPKKPKDNGTGVVQPTEVNFVDWFGEDIV